MLLGHDRLLSPLVHVYEKQVLCDNPGDKGGATLQSLVKGLVAGDAEVANGTSGQGRPGKTRGNPTPLMSSPPPIMAFPPLAVLRVNGTPTRFVSVPN